MSNLRGTFLGAVVLTIVVGGYTTFILVRDPVPQSHAHHRACGGSDCSRSGVGPRDLEQAAPLTILD